MKRGWALGLLLSCAGPQVGDHCEANHFACEDGSTALDCANGSWRAVGCKGPDGCRDLGGLVTCDPRGAAANDSCSIAQNGQALCAPDGKAQLQCRDGTWVQTKVCSSCSLQAEQIVCAP